MQLCANIQDTFKLISIEINLLFISFPLSREPEEDLNFSTAIFFSTLLCSPARYLQILDHSNLGSIWGQIPPPCKYGQIKVGFALQGRPSVICRCSQFETFIRPPPASTLVQHQFNKPFHLLHFQDRTSIPRPLIPLSPEIGSGEIPIAVNNDWPIDLHWISNVSVIAAETKRQDPQLQG